MKHEKKQISIDTIEVNKTLINDKLEIMNKLNEYFCNISQSIVNKINAKLISF